MAYCKGMHPGFRKVMKWCQEQEDPLTEELIEAIQWDPAVEGNGVLYDLLIQITDGEAQSIVENSTGDEQGFEAWRELVRWFDPTNSLNEMDKVNQLLAVPRCGKISEVMRTVSTWEANWAEYLDRSGNTLPEGWRVNLLLRMVPKENEREIRLRYVQKGIKYPELREHISNWALQNTMSDKGPAPMQVDAFGSPKSESEGSSSEDEESDEDQDVAVLRKKGGGKKGKGKDKGRTKGGGKKGKGKDKGGGKRKIQGNCWKCRKLGHMAVDCQASSLEGAQGGADDRDAGSLLIEDEDLDVFGFESSDAEDESDGSFKVVIDRSKPKKKRTFSSSYFCTLYQQFM